MRDVLAIGAALRAAFLPGAAGLPPMPKSRTFAEAVDRLGREANSLTRDLAVRDDHSPGVDDLADFR